MILDKGGEMEYSEFLTNVKAAFDDLLSRENFDARSTEIKKIIKNNDVEFNALIVKDERNNVVPAIYLDSFYRDYLNGRDLYNIVDSIFCLYKNSLGNLDFDVNSFKNFDLVKDSIVFKLIFKKTNRESLKTLVHIDFLDLAIVFMCFFKDDGGKISQIQINNDHLKLWQTDAASLFTLAAKNTGRLLPASIKNMDDIIKDIIYDEINAGNFAPGVVMEDFEDKYGSPREAADGILSDINEIRHTMPMYVLTNSKKINGAACIIYENVLKNFAESIGSDLFILPSSVHEVILIPYDEKIEKSSLNKMVREVNRSELNACDVLSDHVYVYKRYEDKIFI